MTTGLRPYPEYKDSGLPWLGQVPAHWDVKRCKYLFSEVDDRSKSGEETHLSMSQKHGLIPSKDLDGRRLHSESYVGGKLCQTNDLVLNRLKAHLGVFAHASQPGLVSPDYTVLRPVHSDDVVYFELVFKTPACVGELRCSTKGIVEGFWRLYTDDFYNIRVPVPSAEERGQILGFVRVFDAKVRRFIRNRRRLIEVLSEQKQAIINQYVTGRIDPRTGKPYPRYKPSGIDWLGDIPEHWVKRRLKYLVRNVNEQTSARQSDEVYIALEHVEGWTGRITLPSEDSEFDSQVKRFRAGDVLFGKLRPYLAKVTQPDVSGVCVGEFLVLRGTDKILLPEYLEQELRSKQFIDIINSSTFGARMPRADWTFIGNLVIVYPPIQGEQLELLGEIGRQTAAIQAAIDKAKREIDLICEYRTRLIADMVTGKLDVRQATAVAAPAKQPRRAANVYFRRSVFAAEIVHRLHAEPTFGHVKFEKLVFLCERRCGVDTGSTYHRKAAGPYDNRALRSIDSQIKKQKWYEARKGEKGYRYVPLANAGGHREYYDRYFADVATRFDEIIDTFRTARTTQCEIVATLYAAWDDLLSEGNDITDDLIVDQVLHHWHTSKQKIDEARWRRALAWMKAKGLTPELEVSSAGN